MPTTIPSPKPPRSRSSFRCFVDEMLNSVRHFAMVLTFDAFAASSPVPAGASAAPSPAYAISEYVQTEAVTSYFIQQDDVRRAFSKNKADKAQSSNKIMDDLTDTIEKQTDLNARDIALKVFHKISGCYDQLIVLPAHRFCAFMKAMIFNSIVSERRNHNYKEKKMSEFCQEADVLYQGYSAQCAPDEDVDIPANDDIEHLANVVKRILSALTPRQREVMKMYSEGKTYKEIADLLKIKDLTVKSHITKARSRLYRMGITFHSAKSAYAAA